MGELTKAQREALAPYTEMFLAIYDRVAVIGGEDRAQLKAAARACSETNCGWSTYRAAQIVLDAIAMRRPHKPAGRAQLSGGSHD